MRSDTNTKIVYQEQHKFDTGKIGVISLKVIFYSVNLSHNLYSLSSSRFWFLTKCQSKIKSPADLLSLHDRSVHRALKDNLKLKKCYKSNNADRQNYASTERVHI